MDSDEIDETTLSTVEVFEIPTQDEFDRDYLESLDIDSEEGYMEVPIGVVQDNNSLWDFPPFNDVSAWINHPAIDDHGSHNEQFNTKVLRKDGLFLCNACESKATQLSGCVILLQLWAWEHMITGRPRKLALAAQPPGSDIDPARLPALGHKWNVPKSFMHTSHHVLMLYRDLLDRQEANDVVWTPYTDEILAPLNPICLAGRDSWRAEVPLICFHIAEWHYPSRVLCQFGWGQSEPALPPASHKEMHRHIRRTAHLVDDVMQGYINLWDNRAAHIVTGEADTDGSYLEPYYSWYTTVTRKRIQPPLYTPEPYRPSGHEHYLMVASLVRNCKMSANMFLKTTDKEVKRQLHDMFHANRADLLKIGEGRALDVDDTQIHLLSDSDEDLDLPHDTFDVGPSQVTQAESQRSPLRRVSTRARKTTQRFTPSGN